MRLHGFRIEFDLLANDLPELLGRLHGLKAAVEVNRRLDIAVPKEAPHGFVISGMMLEIQRCSGMAELVDSEPQARSLVDPLDDLGAEHVRRLGVAGHAREQPGGVRAAQQHRPELMNVLIDELGQGLVELEVEVDPVLDVIVRKDQPVGRVQAPRLDQVLSQLDRHEIAEPDGRER